MRNVFAAGPVALVIAAAMIWAAPQLSAQRASQITMSCTTPNPHSGDPNGCRSSQSVPFFSPDGTKALFLGGFWVWCQNPNNKGPYADCNGAVYVEEIDLATGAAKYDVTSISGDSSVGGPTGLQATIESKDGDTTCVFDVPASPTSGPSNTVNGTCNGVPITLMAVVANVT